MFFNKKFDEHWPEDYIELHAARLLILILIAGEGIRKKKIKSRTKLAKLDFFLRYPYYLKKASTIIGNTIISNDIKETLDLPIEPTMIRYYYGPWDQRYYDILNYLLARDLIEIKKDAQNIDNFVLTNLGKIKAEELSKTKPYDYLVKVAKLVGSLFGNFSGNKLKKFIYKHFPEIVSLPHENIIRGEKENGT